MATATLTPELKAIRKARLDEAALARSTGRSLRTASRWLAGETAPRGRALEQLRDLTAVLEAFKVAFPRASAGEWLLRRDPELEFATPAELIAAGRSREVLALLRAIAEGVYF